MTDDVNSKLDDIFNARAERLAAATQAQIEKEKKQDAALEEFLALKESVIRPALDALSQNLSDRGQESKVFETQVGERSGDDKHEIGIRFLLDAGARFSRGNEYPHLTLSFDKSARKVQFYRCTMSPGKGGMAGGDGSADFDSLTEDLINQKALKVIADVFK